MISDDAFRTIYNENASGVRAFLFHKCGPQNLDDLVQQTFIKVWKNASKFESRSSQKTWIFKIALNVAYDFYRKRGTVGELFQDHHLAAEANSDDKIILEQALSKLEPKQKDLCLLYYYEGFGIKEISQVLEVPEGTVKSRLHEVRLILKDLLKENS
ncbi:RNA polymerase sigma factor [bacterium]|nr:RNA polymerase sigma factor [bacterium]